jgi:hypothetical protein
MSTKTRASQAPENPLPKKVTLRVSLREYKKLLQVALLAEEIKDNKEVKKALREIIRHHPTLNPEEVEEKKKGTGKKRGGKEEKKSPGPSPDLPPLSFESFVGVLVRLPHAEVNLSRPNRRDPPKGSYFTNPHPTTKEVKALYKALQSHPDLQGKIRYNPMKETCPSDVRSMFYLYVHEKGLVMEGEIVLDKLLLSLAPKTLEGLKRVKRKDNALIWKVCSEIRGR